MQQQCVATDKTSSAEEKVGAKECVFYLLPKFILSNCAKNEKRAMHRLLSCSSVPSVLASVGRTTKKEKKVVAHVYN